MRFAKIGLGIACVIKELVQKELDSGMLVEIPLDIPIHRRTIGFAYHPANQAMALKHFWSFVLIFRTYIFAYVSCPLFCIYKTGGIPGFFRGHPLVVLILTCIRQDPRTQSM